MREIVRVSVAVALLLASGCGGRVDGTQSGTRADDDLVFVPATYGAGDRVVLPLTFPDGTSAELVYPPELEIAELGVFPYTSGTLHGESTEPGRGDSVARDFVIRHADVQEVLDRYGPRPEPLAKYEGADGRTVVLWDVARNDTAHYLGFQFGGWAVLVYDYVAAGAMTDAERASWSASFRGRETADGFLVLDGVGPLRLAAAGEHAGPGLTLSDGEPNRAVRLFPGECRPTRFDRTRLVDGKLVSGHGPFASWCLSDSMRVHAEGSRDFVGPLIRELEVRHVTIATG